MDVEFITLGMAAEKLNVPPPTLRNWTQKLEELDIHYLDRNDRDERLFYKNDLEIFRYIKENKDRYGRKATTTSLAETIAQNERFKVRTEPTKPQAANSDSSGGLVRSEREIRGISELINHSDFQDMLSEFGKEVARAQAERVEEIIEVKTEEIRNSFNEKLDELEKVRINKMDELIHAQREAKKAVDDFYKLPLYKRLFKKPTND
jgi:DNA-binding transcriptional MerR regulator